MVIFNSFLLNYQRVVWYHFCVILAGEGFGFTQSLVQRNQRTLASGNDCYSWLLKMAIETRDFTY